MEWLSDHKIPVGDWAEDFFLWLQDNAAGFFDALAILMETLIDAFLWVLQTPHPLVIIAVFVGLTWALQRNWKTCLFVALGFLFILNQGYWEETTESLTLVLSSCIFCMAMGVPIGIAAAHRPRLYDGMRPVLDLMQTLPPFVYLIPAIVFFGIGMVPGLIATVIFVVPAPIRLTHLASPTRRSRCWRRHRRLVPPIGKPCGRWSCPTPCRRSWRGSTRPSCCRSRWW